MVEKPWYASSSAHAAAPVLPILQVSGLTYRLAKNEQEMRVAFNTGRAQRDMQVCSCGLVPLCGGILGLTRVECSAGT